MRSLIRLVCSLFLVACASSQTKPFVSPEDCAARLDCRVVTVDNTSNKFNIDVRINGAKYGNVSSYSAAAYSLYTSNLVHGNCAVVSIRFVESGIVRSSDEQCISANEYYAVSVTYNPLYVWLTPFRVR